MRKKPVQPREAERFYDRMSSLEKAVLPRVLAGECYAKIYQSIRGEHVPGWEASSRVRKIIIKKNNARWLKIMREEYIAKAVMDRQEALERLSEIARAKVSDLLIVDKFGRLSFNRDVNARMGAVAEIKETKYGTTFKLVSPLQAINQMATMEGWNMPTKMQVEVTESTLDTKKLSTEAMEELLLAADETGRLTSD